MDVLLAYMCTMYMPGPLRGSLWEILNRTWVLYTNKCSCARHGAALGGKGRRGAAEASRAV